MTRKEVIDTLKVAKAEVEWNYPMNYYLAIDQAVKYAEIPEKLVEYRRNNATLEWQAVGGECKKCGLRWFV